MDIEKTICLNMIVKDESEIIITTLNNLCDYIKFNYWVISDTGSTDNTKELIIDFFKEKNIPGELIENKWKDFSSNRNKALNHAYNKTDYLFIFDADDSINGNLILPKQYEHDQYNFYFEQEHHFTRPLLINNKKRWIWKGVLHEVLCALSDINITTLIGDYYIKSGRVGNRNKNPNKYLNDAIVLKNAFKIEKDILLKSRYAFYCGQSYKDHATNNEKKYYDNSIKWYKKCLTLNNWDQEKYIACKNIGEMYIYKNDYNNALKYWYNSIKYDNERIECIVMIMKLLQEHYEHHYVVNLLYHKYKDYNHILDDKLFIETWVNYKLEYYNIISAYYTNDKQSGYDCCKKLILNNINITLIFEYLINYIDELKNDKDTLQLFNILENHIKSSNINNLTKIYDILYELNN